MLVVLCARLVAYPLILSSRLFSLSPKPSRLDSCVVRNGGNCLGGVVVEGDGDSSPWQSGQPLQLDGGAISLGLLLQSGVGLDATQEVLAGPGRRDVLNANVQALLDVPVLDLLVDDDADGVLGDVVDDARLAVVDLVRHTVCDVSVQSFGFLSASPAFFHSDPSTFRFAPVAVAFPFFAFEEREFLSRGGRRSMSFAYPFCTAPFVFRSTMSPTL